MRHVIAWAIFLACTAVSAAGEEYRVVDPSGKVIAVILDCNSCADPSSGTKCVGGVQDGFHAGKRCGQCLLTANFGTRLLYPHDLQITGTLTQPDGTALADEFVRLFLPNTWTVRTRTTENGYFRLLLGATEDRKGEMVAVDLGSRSRSKSEDAVDYSFFMVPESHKPCPE